MTTMSSTVKTAIVFSAIGIAVGIGIMLVMVDNQTLMGMLQLGISEDDDNNPLDERPFRYRAFYKAILNVGDEGTYAAEGAGGKAPYTFEWNFSDGITLKGQNVTRSFDSPGIYYFNLTVTDADGKQVKSTELNTNIVPETSKEEEGTANTTSVSTIRRE
jgi:hypothetical protein